ncbi:MAG: peptide deformylase [Alphaproteobacteria bacterium]|nr:peptide deformylase [Alphaproteobacteria bacterium]
MFISKNLRNYTAFLITSVGLLIFDPCSGGTSAPKKEGSQQNNMQEEIAKNDEDNKNPKSFEDIAGADFVFIGENGIKFKFPQLKGHIIIVAFSTTWCPNCPIVLKSLDNLRSKLLEKNMIDIGVLALNIGNEDIEEVKEHYKKYDINMLKPYKSISKANGIEGVPACFVFDDEGKIVHKYFGWHDFASDDFLKLLKELSKKADWRNQQKRNIIRKKDSGNVMTILTYGNPILKAKCDPVKVGDKEAIKILDNMVATLHNESNGIGLAAPQVGISKRLVVIDLHEESGKIYKMINPKVIWKSEETAEFMEGCLSIPGICEKVKRPASVSVEYLDETFKQCLIEKATGLLAVCLQHEIDHLDGKLYIDRLSRMKRARIISKYKKLQEQKIADDSNNSENK